MRDESIASFERSLRGSLVRGDDPGYDQARAVFNGTIDKRPLLIARCADPVDVAAAVNFGRDNDLLIAIRGGGHSAAGFGSCDGGLVIDLSAMRTVRVDPSSCTVAADAGCTQGEVDRATSPFGLAVPCGVFPATGISGLTLGGGHGYLSRKYGLSIDSLIGAGVVLADGSSITADERENTDLLWALRGGGGNFGVVTRLVFRAHPVGIVDAGLILWEDKHTRAVMQWYRDLLPRADKDFYSFLSLQTVPATEPFRRDVWGKPAVGLVVCCHGSREKRQRAFREMHQTLPQPLFDGIGEMPFHEMQSMAEGAFPPGLHWYWKGAFLESLSDAAIEIHLEQFARAPSDLCHVHFYPIDGVVHHVFKNETAWNCRSALWSLDIAAVDADPQKAGALKKWANDYLEALRPFTLKGGYVNFMMDDDGQSRIKAAYGDNYPRLQSLKKKFDPANLFRVNQNIKPRTDACGFG